MAEVPVFSPQVGGTNFRNIKGITTAGFDAKSNLLNQMAAVTDRQVEIINAREDDRVKKESMIKGQEAGLESDFDPNGIPKENTIAANAFKAGAFQTFTIQQQTALDTGIARLEVQHGADPNKFITMAEAHISGATENLPAELKVNLELLATKTANAAYIRIQKKALKAQADFAIKTVKDRVKFLTTAIPDMNPQSKAEIDDKAKMEAELVSLQESAILNGTMTPGEVLLANKKMVDESIVNAETRFILQSPNPVKSLEKLMRNDALGVDIKSAVVTKALQAQAAFDRQEKEDEELEEERREQRDLDGYRSINEDPSSQTSSDFVTQISDEARTVDELQLAERMDKKRQDVDAERFLSSSTSHFAETIKTQAAQGIISEQEISELIGGGGSAWLSRTDGMAAIQLARSTKQLLSTGTTMQYVNSRLEQFYPVVKLTAAQIIMGSRLTAGEQKQNTRNLSLRQRHMAVFKRGVEEKKLTSEDAIMEEFKEVEASMIQQSNQNVGDVDETSQDIIKSEHKVRRIEEIRSNPVTASREIIVIGHISLIRKQNPKLTGNQALARTLATLVRNKEISGKEADDLQLIIMDKFEKEK